MTDLKLSIDQTGSDPQKIAIGFRIGAFLVATIVAAAVISFIWTPYDVVAIEIASKLLPPSLTYPFGTDHFGRDVLSMIMVGARNSLAVALVAVVIGAGIGALAVTRHSHVMDALLRLAVLVDPTF